MSRSRRVLKGHSGRAVSILYRGENREGLTPTTPEYRQIRDRAKAIVDRENIIHWEIEFPHIMSGEVPRLRRRHRQSPLGPY